jgi:hypothetical protein
MFRKYSFIGNAGLTSAKVVLYFFSSDEFLGKYFCTPLQANRAARAGHLSHAFREVRFIIRLSGFLSTPGKGKRPGSPVAFIEDGESSLSVCFLSSHCL